MAEDLGEKTEAPTPRRLREAREEGNVARSMDLAGALVLAGMSVGLMFLLVPMFWRLAVLLERLLDPSGGAGAIVTLEALPAALEQSIMSGVLALVLPSPDVFKTKAVLDYCLTALTMSPEVNSRMAGTILL